MLPSPLHVISLPVAGLRSGAGTVDCELLNHVINIFLTLKQTVQVKLRESTHSLVRGF